MRDDPKWNIEFVKVVEKYPVIYDSWNEGHGSKDSTESAWKEVARAVGESVFNCKDKWRNLRTSLTRHLRNMNEPSALSGKYRKPYYMAPYMSFLIPYTKSRTVRPESPWAKGTRRRSLDSSFRRRYADRTDSSSYDSFGLTLEDHPTARPRDHEEDGKRPRLTSSSRALDAAGRACDRDDERRVQPKLEDLDEEERGECLDARTDGDEDEEDVVTGEQEDTGRKGRDAADEGMAEEQDSQVAGAAAIAEGTSSNAGDRTTQNNNSSSSSSNNNNNNSNNNAPTSSRASGTLLGTSGHAGRVAGDPQESALLAELDDDSWSGCFREEDDERESWQWEGRRGSDRVVRGVGGGSVSRIARVSRPEGRNSQFGVEHLSHSSADMDFFRSILSDVSSLTPSQRSRFRMTILKSLHEMLYEES